MIIAVIKPLVTYRFSLCKSPFRGYIKFQKWMIQHRTTTFKWRLRAQMTANLSYLWKWREWALPLKICFKVCVNTAWLWYARPNWSKLKRHAPSLNITFGCYRSWMGRRWRSFPYSWCWIEHSPKGELPLKIMQLYSNTLFTFF